jgi:23S rRNA (cytidine1920-2'-O)/16S rRNA (cytidine1409-2'-O)-methyltransferase
MEGVNARDLTAEMVPEPIDLLVSDVSFVSVIKVLAAPLALCTSSAAAVILFKPQFEVGRRNVGKGGIVSDQEAIDTALAEVIAFMAQHGFEHLHSVISPIAGGDGNVETVLVFARRSPA